jgi:hypothetical protein
VATWFGDGSGDQQMRRLAAAASSWLLVTPLVGSLVWVAPISAAQECSHGSLRGNLLSQGDEAKLAINGKYYQCRAPSIRSAEVISGPVYTFEVLCNPDSDQGPRTLCSAAPCLQANRSLPCETFASLTAALNRQGINASTLDRRRLIRE